MAGASLVLAAAVAGVAGAAEPAAKPDRVTLRAQLGVIYAQNGQVEEARKEFVKLLEEPTGRAAALTNLGNLAMLDGHADVAIENYMQASVLDTTDGGILLNLGIAHKQLGHDDEAVAAIARALTRTGGTERAEYLLGIRTAGEPSKGKASKLSNEEIRAMLEKAKKHVPDATAAANGAQKAKTTPVVSRPGGARAADVAVGATSLYWKEK
jgi:tetratricopeptide (TPR) repeat protein